MQDALNHLWDLAAVGVMGALGVAVKFLLSYSKLVAQQTAAEVQNRLAEAASRAAGRLLTQIDHATPQNLNSMIHQEAGILAARFAETMLAHNIKPSTIIDMIKGEAGKLGAKL